MLLRTHGGKEIDIAIDLLLGRHKSLKSIMDVRGDLRNTHQNFAEDLLLTKTKKNMVLEKSQSRNTRFHQLSEESCGEDLLSSEDVKSRKNNDLNEGRMIFEIIEEGDTSKAKLVIENLLNKYRIDQIINVQGMSLLHVACLNENFELVKFLITKAIELSSEISCKIYVDMKWKDATKSFNALHIGCFTGNISILEYLLKYGGDLTIRSNQGLNSLHAAAQGDQPAMIYYLVKNGGVFIDEQDNVGNTALHWSCSEGNINSLKFLISLGAKVNIQNDEGTTPLHCAVRSIEQYWAMNNIKLLLLEGAKRNIRDNGGNKPIHYTQEIQTLALK